MHFRSKFREHVLIKEPSDRTIDPNTRKATVIRGKKAEFHEYMYNTYDPEMIDWLVNHPQFGVHFFSIESADDWRKARAAGLDPTKQQPVRMVTGGNDASNRSMVIMGDSRPTPLVEIKQPEVKQEIKPETKTLISPELVDIIAKVVNQALDARLGEPKKRAKFHCPICKEEFKTGMAVGKHKKEAHPEPKESE